MYTMPVGIPDPSNHWGTLDPINDAAPDAPVNWANGPVDGFYYVNPQTGSDDNNEFGHPGQPRATIPTLVEAGAYVELHGDFGASDIPINNWQGTEDNPIWLRGTGLTGENHVSSGSLEIINAAYF